MFKFNKKVRETLSRNMRTAIAFVSATVFATMWKSGASPLLCVCFVLSAAVAECLALLLLAV